MSMRKTACIYAACGVALIASFAGVQLAFFAANADEIRLRAMVPEVRYEPGSGTFTAQHDRDIMRIYNDVGRQLEWDDEDRDWVAEIIGSGWPDIEVDPESDTYEAWSLFKTTLTIVGERIGNGIPTDERIAELYRETVVDMLGHPQGRVRQKGVTAIALAGMLEDPVLIASLEFMAEYDAHEGVRRAASVKLRQHQGIETASDDCPSCPRSQP